MANIRITKVGSKEGKITVRGEEDRGGDLVKTEIDSDVKPIPEFDQSLAELGKYLCALMGFPDDWKRDSTTLWLSVGHEQNESGQYERINAIVTIRVKLTKFNNGITVNSPLLREKIQGVPGGGSFMPPKMLELVKAVMEQGEKYMDGERAQHELLPRAERGSRKAKKAKEDTEEKE